MVIAPKAGAPVKSIQERIVDGKNAIMRDFQITPEEMAEYMLNKHDGSDDGSVLAHLIGLYGGLKSGEYTAHSVFRKKEKGIQEPGEKKTKK